MRRYSLILALLLLVAAAGSAFAQGTVPGQADRTDTDNNGYPDAGVVVNGHYKALQAFDASGDYYLELGDGRVLGTVDSVDDLEPATRTVCRYAVSYRGTFDNDPGIDTGWVNNHINCRGYADNGKYNFLTVHESDPRYTGNPDRIVPGWGGWEYHVSTVSGFGNLMRPMNHIN